MAMFSIFWYLQWNCSHSLYLSISETVIWFFCCHCSLWMATFWMLFHLTLGKCSKRDSVWSRSRQVFTYAHLRREKASNKFEWLLWSIIFRWYVITRWLQSQYFLTALTFQNAAPFPSYLVWTWLLMFI